MLFLLPESELMLEHQEQEKIFANSEDTSCEQSKGPEILSPPPFFFSLLL